jgi:N-acetylmuramoyl-L-alanine amidase
MHRPGTGETAMTFNIRGKVSWFGGPDDTGVSPSEGLAFIYKVSDAPHLFLDQQPSGTSGLARRLDPEEFYIACRWDYNLYPKPSLLQHTALVRSLKTGKSFEAYPSDWGPHEDTGRVADISPGLMDALGITTDDEVEVIYPYEETDEEVAAMPYPSICISSGHGKIVRGASGILDEVDEARKVVEQVAVELRDRGVKVDVFHDNTSTSQNQNLNTIVNHHNAQHRDLDVSVHFNAYEQVSKPMGVECLYVTQTALAADISDAIAACGFINRGAKKRTDLFFLNNTNKPAILIEVCFVDSSADAELYRAEFDAVCTAIADVLGGVMEETAPPPVDVTRPPRPAIPAGRIDITISGDVTVTINGVVCWPQDE